VSRLPPEGGSVVFACAGGNELAVGERRLELAHLPSLVPRWTWPVGPSPVHDVAMLESFLAYTTRKSSDMVLTRRPMSGRSARAEAVRRTGLIAGRVGLAKLLPLPLRDAFVARCSGDGSHVIGESAPRVS